MLRRTQAMNSRWICKYSSIHAWPRQWKVWVLNSSLLTPIGRLSAIHQIGGFEGHTGVLRALQKTKSLVNAGSQNMTYSLYGQVTVHRDKLLTKQPTRCIIYSKVYFVIKLYMFRASSVPIIRSYLLYTRQLVCFMQVMWPLPSRVRLEMFCLEVVI